MRLVVFTTVLGKVTDPLKEPEPAYPNVEYRCFTDQRLSSQRWTIVRVPRSTYPCFDSRRMKILSHKTVPDADITLWIDAAFQIHCDPRAVACQWLQNSDIAALRHPHRDNIEQEGRQIIKLGLAPQDPILAQIEDYARQGFPAHSQKRITSTGLCLRRHSPQVRRFNETWWELFSATGHTRDQMSVDFALHKTGLKVAYFPGHYRDTQMATFHTDRSWRHRKPRGVGMR